MSAIHQHWQICTDPAHQAAAVAASGLRPTIAALPKGASRSRLLVKALPTDTAPAIVVACPVCHVGPQADWLAVHDTAAWVPAFAGATWAGDEKAVLIPEAEGGKYPAGALGDWSSAERITLDKATLVGLTSYEPGVYRLVRYTGTKPGTLSPYPFISATNVVAAVALKEP